MKVLSRDELLRKRKLEVRRVDLGPGESVYVRQMCGRERDSFEQSIIRTTTGPDGELVMERSLEDFRAKLAVRTICDEEGNLLLKEEDVEALSTRMPAAQLEMIVNAAQELNGITRKDRENLVKNLEPGQSGNSTSDSAGN